MSDERNEEIEEHEIKDDDVNKIEVSEFKSPLTNTSKFDVDKTKKNTLIYLSTEKYNAIRHLEEVMKSEGTIEIAKKFNEDDVASLYIASEGKDQTYKDNTLSNLDQDEERLWDQLPTDNDKELGLRQVPVNKNIKGSISGKRAKLKFSNYLGVGGITQIPLWHSGFWISLKPISESEIVDLDIRIGRNQIKLGRDTNGAIFSNADVIHDRILMDFIVDNISDATLKLTEDDDIRDYIKMQDFHTLILGLIEAISPKGFGVTLSCKNVTNLTEENGIECNYIVTGKIDPKKLLFVDRNSLTRNQLKHMSKRSPNSMEVSDIKNYVEELNILKDRDVIIKTSIEHDLFITIKTPNIQEHILHGTDWVESTISMVEDLMKDETSDESKSLKVEEMSKTTLLNTYIHFIKEIRTDDGAKVDNSTDISEILDLIVQDKTAFRNTVTEIRKYIKENIITMIGTPVYICPKCKEDQEVNDGVFKEIIPLNVVSSFFDLGALRKSQLMERESITY